MHYWVVLTEGVRQFATEDSFSGRTEDLTQCGPQRRELDTVGIKAHLN